MSLFYHSIIAYLLIVFFFFFNDTATTEIYTLSLHDALPIFAGAPWLVSESVAVTLKSNAPSLWADRSKAAGEDRKSTRLNSSHSQISYAVFCLKKKRVDLAGGPAHHPGAAGAPSAGVAAPARARLLHLPPFAERSGAGGRGARTVQAVRVCLPS